MTRGSARQSSSSEFSSMGSKWNGTENTMWLNLKLLAFPCAFVGKVVFMYGPDWNCIWLECCDFFFPLGIWQGWRNQPTCWKGWADLPRHSVQRCARRIFIFLELFLNQLAEQASALHPEYHPFVCRVWYGLKSKFSLDQAFKIWFDLFPVTLLKCSFLLFFFFSPSLPTC